MSTSDSSVSPFSKYHDEIVLLGAALLTLVPAIFVAGMVRRAWTFSPLKQSVNEVLVGFTANSVAAVLFGVYLAALCLLYIDSKKRAQSLLLFAATGVALVVFWRNGVFVMDLSVADVVLTIGGLGVGIVGIGGEKLQYLHISNTSDVLTGRIIEGKGQAPIEFPRAERVLFFLLAGFIGLSFFEAHTNYPQLLVVEEGTLFIQDVFQDFTLVDMTPGVLAFDVVASGLFLGAFNWFMGYDANKSVFVLGPSGSGKTHLITGLYIEAQENAMRPRNASDELTQQVQRIIEQGGFIQQRTREAMDLSFQYTAGRYFPKNVYLDAFDYPGEYLPHIPAGIDVLNEDMSKYDYEDVIRDQVNQGVAIDQSKGVVAGGQRDSNVATDGGQSAESNEATPQQNPETVLDIGDDAIRERARVMVEEVCPRIMEADLLLFVIDMDRVMSDDSDTLDTEWYSNILARLPDDKAAVFVATKADLLMSDEAGMGAQAWQSPEQYQNHVDNMLREHMGAGGLSIAEKPYPVYYQTYEEDGERKMALGDAMSFDSVGGMNNRRPKLYGFKRLLDRMGR